MNLDRRRPRGFLRTLRNSTTAPGSPATVTGLFRVKGLVSRCVPRARVTVPNRSARSLRSSPASRPPWWEPAGARPAERVAGPRSDRGEDTLPVLEHEPQGQGRPDLVAVRTEVEIGRARVHRQGAR